MAVWSWTKPASPANNVFTLHWQPRHLYADAPEAKPVSDSDGDGPSLFAALRDQLGLRLKTAKGPVQIIVVDAVSSPTPN
jgi:uncharacterized protein (TIGR03435 family)